MCGEFDPSSLLLCKLGMMNARDGLSILDRNDVQHVFCQDADVLGASRWQINS
jgi:hypothetical protein